MASETDRVVDKRLTKQLSLFALLAFAARSRPRTAWSQLAPGSMDVHWNEGSADCAKNPQPPLQQHQYNPRDIHSSRESLHDFRGAFHVPSDRINESALDRHRRHCRSTYVPLADTVMSLLPGEGPQNYPCLSFIPIGTSIIAPAMNSSRNFPMLRSSVLISTAFGATTTSSIGQTASRKSISVIERST